MSVYLIRAGENGPVKIGHARNPERRMAGFQTGHYERLSLLRTWPGGQPEEAALHRAFSEYRLNGEWFRFCPAMLDADVKALVDASLAAKPSRAPPALIDFDGPITVRSLIVIAGGPTKLAKALNLSHSTVLTWKQIPADHVPAISAFTGLSRHDLRPDLWEPPSPPPPDQAAA